MSGRRRVAILGGGLGGLSAALELTATPELRARHAVTVYQIGWRLGGKCASGRGADGRVEEHGLHVLLGAYENAFALMRRVYAELARPPGTPLASFEEAFLPHDEVEFAEVIDGAVRPWTVRFPRNGRAPGDGGLWPGPSVVLGTLRGWLAEGTGQLAAAIEARLGRRPLRGSARRALRAALARLAASPDPLRGTLNATDDAPGEALAAALRDDDALRRLWILLDLGAAVARGFVADGLATRGFSAIDGEDFRGWLRRHGASSVAVESALLRAIYDLVFHGPAGGAAGGFAAGTALRMSLRFLFGYKGAVGWWMAAGTGETLIAPIYEVLRARGVAFRFFHRVTRLELSADRTQLSRVHLGVQARPRGDTYDPLTTIDGLPSWPATPDWAQLQEGETLEARGIDLESSWSGWNDVGETALALGRDVDDVVLAVPIAALGSVCAELGEASPRWRAMLQGIPSTPTLALQVWSSPPRIDGKPMANTGIAPLTGYGDMSHLLRWERWPAERRPGHVLHVCCRHDAPPPPPAGADPYPEDQRRRAHDLGKAWLRGGGAAFVPGATRDAQPGPVDWRVLADPEDRDGEERFEAQYWRLNVEPSDRYELCVPGSPQLRLRADESGFAGLVLAGTWTRTGLDVGSVEAAVASGRGAARAICGAPAAIAGEHDWR